MLGGSNPSVIFCNVYFICAPRSWIGSVQMKSSMRSIRGNRCIERERETYNFKSREVKCVKDCSLALNMSALRIIVSHQQYCRIAPSLGKRGIGSGSNIYTNVYDKRDDFMIHSTPEKDFPVLN